VLFSGADWRKLRGNVGVKTLPFLISAFALVATACADEQTVKTEPEPETVTVTTGVAEDETTTEEASDSSARIGDAIELEGNSPGAPGANCP
jgi:hypothetical protein